MDGNDDDMTVGTAIGFLVGNTDDLQNGAVVDGRMNEGDLDVGPVLRTLVGLILSNEVGDEIGFVVGELLGLFNSSFVGVEEGAVDGDDVGAVVSGENEGD